MAIEIISIPYAQSEKSGWFLKSLEIDLATSHHELSFTKYPISQSKLLPIGAKIENGIHIERANGAEKYLYFEDFNQGNLVPLSALPERIYGFKVPNSIYDETFVYSIFHKGRRTVFFTYELFRQFIGFDSQICRYIMEQDMLEIFIDNQKISEKDGKTTLALEFNSLMSIGLVQNNEFMNNYIFLLYNKELRRYWKEIQGNTNNGQNNFSFNKAPFKNFGCKAKIKEYKDFDLVLYITSKEIEVEFPFDNLKIKHPKIKERDKKGSQGNGLNSEKIDNEIPREYNFEDEDSTPNQNKHTNVSVNTSGFKFKKSPNIQRIKAKADKNDKPKRNKKLYEEFKLKDIELSFQEPGNQGNVSVPVLTDFKNEQSFDFTEVPKGLQLFCNAVTILARIMNIQFQYEIIEFDKSIKSSFISIEGRLRKAVLITFPNVPAIYLLEVDSSDKRFISTLIFKKLKLDKEKFLAELLTKISTRNGSWDTEYLKSKCVAEKIKHPKRLAKYDCLSKEKVDSSLEKRIAFNFLNILG